MQEDVRSPRFDNIGTLLESDEEKQWEKEASDEIVEPSNSIGNNSKTVWRR